MRAFERFLKYVAVNTQSDDTTGTHPSFAGEYDLAHILEAEISDMKLTNIVLTDKCYLYAHLPASAGYENATPIAFIAHMDTSPYIHSSSVSRLTCI